MNLRFTLDEIRSRRIALEDAELFLAEQPDAVRETWEYDLGVAKAELEAVEDHLLEAVEEVDYMCDRVDSFIDLLGEATGGVL